MLINYFKMSFQIDFLIHIIGIHELHDNNYMYNFYLLIV